MKNKASKLVKIALTAGLAFVSGCGCEREWIDSKGCYNCVDVFGDHYVECPDGTKGYVRDPEEERQKKEKIDNLGRALGASMIWDEVPK